MIDPIIYDELPNARRSAPTTSTAARARSASTAGRGRLLHPGDVGLGHDPQRSDRPICCSSTPDAATASSINTLNARYHAPPRRHRHLGGPGAERSPSRSRRRSTCSTSSRRPTCGSRALAGPAATGFDLTIDGDIRNMIGTTTITQRPRQHPAPAPTAPRDVLLQHRGPRLRARIDRHGREPDPPRALSRSRTPARSASRRTLQAGRARRRGRAWTCSSTLTAIRRAPRPPRSTAPITPQIGPLKAGHDVVVTVYDSQRGQRHCPTSATCRSASTRPTTRRPASAPATPGADADDACR